MSKQSRELTPAEALAYWRKAAHTLHTLLGNLPATTPSTGEFPALVDELRDTATAHLLAANALVGHYTMLEYPPTGRSTGAPTAPAAHRSTGTATGQPSQEWPPVGPNGSYVPPARSASVPGAGRGTW